MVGYMAPSLPGTAEVIHIIFSMPVMTLLFRNYYLSIPQELFNAAVLGIAVVMPLRINWQKA